MSIFRKSTCLACNSCKCSCVNRDIKITQRTYTYNELDDLCTKEDTNTFPCIPTERIILNSDGSSQLYYHQIDNEFYAKNILNDVPLISYAQGPFFERINYENNKSYRLPTLTYVCDPIYIRRKQKCAISQLADCVCPQECKCD
ncbi:inner membrane complex protein, putative [Plasmodium vinckei]|uniref:Inner membrane complex protein, putative n=1 Tax=Plasmodium vinckei TaxID=5860 RepID=A0A6V7TAD2_PLAVN|nr:inner membrane complex protein, putative [Plasmodium vinckei]